MIHVIFIKVLFLRKDLTQSAETVKESKTSKRKSNKEILLICTITKLDFNNKNCFQIAGLCSPDEISPTVKLLILSYGIFIVSKLSQTGEHHYDVELRCF